MSRAGWSHLDIWLKSAVYLIAFVWSASIFSIMYLVLLSLFLPRNFLWRYFVRPGCWCCLRLTGQKVKIESQYPDRQNGPYLYLANHESLLDAFLFGQALPDRATALGAKLYFYLPLWGWMMKLHGIIPVDQRRHSQAVGAVSKAEQAIGRGESVVVFPEGERSVDGKIQRFKKGAFHLAKNTHVTIVPCVIDGPYRSWRRNSWLIKSGTLRLKFLEPITYAEYIKEYDQFGVIGIADLVQAKIQAGKADFTNAAGGN